MLQSAGLRPTRQRMALGWLLFGKGARHLTAEMLYEEATHAKVPVSLATVYNTLNQLTDAGLLRQVSVDGAKTYFDTNVTTHHHFYLEHNHELIDIPDPHPFCRPCQTCRKVTRSPASIWSCGCARSAERPQHQSWRMPGLQRRIVVGRRRVPVACLTFATACPRVRLTNVRRQPTSRPLISLPSLGTAGRSARSLPIIRQPETGTLALVVVRPCSG